MMGLTEPHLLVYKLLGNMGKSLIEGNKKQAGVIKQEIIIYGYEVMVKNWKI